MMNYEMELRNGSVTWYKVTEPNEKGETLGIELVECTNLGGKNSLPYLWYRDGFTDKILETYLSINTYCTDSEGRCSRKYNPQVKKSNNRSVINFDWLFENTEENRQKLINEVIRLFESAKGKSATEEKMEKILEYAKENGLKIVYEKPTNWMCLNGIHSPYGSVVIKKKNKFFDKTCEKALLVY